MIDNSLPEMLNVIGLDLNAPDEPVSGSVAVTVPNTDSFSLTEKLADEVIVGALSFKSTTVIVIS